MKKQLLIAAVAATMGTAVIADVSITGNAKFEYFNTETSTLSKNTTNTEVNLGIKGKNGDTSVVIDLEFNTHGATDTANAVDAANTSNGVLDVENLYMTTKIGDVTVKGGNYASGTSGILGEIENGGRANNKVTISGSNAGVSWYAGNSGTAGAGATQIDGNMFVGASMDVAGWKVQAKHNSATVDSFGISGNVSGLGVRLEQRNDTAANGDTTFGNLTYSTNGIDLAYAWLDSDKANKIDEDDSSIFAVENGIVSAVTDTGNAQISAKTSIGGNSVTVKSGSVENGLATGTDLDYMQIAVSRPLASGATFAATYTDKDDSTTTDTQILELDLSVKF
jgi:azurin